MNCTAFHEAGHAVAHILTGIPFKYIPIKEDAELSVFEYIEAWYNVNGIHTAIKASIKNKKEILINQLVA